MKSYDDNHLKNTSLIWKKSLLRKSSNMMQIAKNMKYLVNTEKMSLARPNLEKNSLIRKNLANSEKNVANEEKLR